MDEEIDFSEVFLFKNKMVLDCTKKKYLLIYQFLFVKNFLCWKCLIISQYIMQSANSKMSKSKSSILRCFSEVFKLQVKFHPGKLDSKMLVYCTIVRLDQWGWSVHWASIPFAEMLFSISKAVGLKDKVWTYLKMSLTGMWKRLNIVIKANVTAK